MKILAMRNYPAVEKFLRFSQPTTVKTSQAPLPPLNLSAYRRTTEAAERWARIDAMEKAGELKQTVEMPVPVFNYFLSIFKG